MSLTEMPAALARQAPEAADQARSTGGSRLALVVLFAAAAVVFASSLAVVTGLV